MGPHAGIILAGRIGNQHEDITGLEAVHQPVAAGEGRSVEGGPEAGRRISGCGVGS